LADSFEVKHGKVKFDEKEEYLHSFNERGTGYNITSESYNFNDSNDGTYISYKTDKNAFSKKSSKDNYAGSAITTDNKAFNAIILIGILIGIAVGAVAVALPENSRNKKRKKNEA
ncbi:MAG: hypothetical protein K6D02_02080, partial [Lachnospiraceae bacterium]|nr:hypothetical protein [Lachnospiraceae bacterium]